MSDKDRELFEKIMAWYHLHELYSGDSLSALGLSAYMSISKELESIDKLGTLIRIIEENNL